MSIFHPDTPEFTVDTVEELWQLDAEVGLTNVVVSAPRAVFEEAGMGEETDPEDWRDELEAEYAERAHAAGAGDA